MEAFLVGFANKLVTVEGDNSYFLEKTADLFAVQCIMELFLRPQRLASASTTA